MNHYIVDTISKETLQEYGFDSSLVSDNQMEQIARVLRHIFRECVLIELPQIAEEYGIPKSTQTCYAVSRIYVSLNEDSKNHYDSKFFYNKENAKSQLKEWRNEEFELCKKSGTLYEVVFNEEECFKMNWDDDRELLSIGIIEIEPENL